MKEIAYLEHQTVKNFLDCGHHVAFAMLIAHVIWYQKCLGFTGEKHLRSSENCIWACFDGKHIKISFLSVEILPLPC